MDNVALDEQRHIGFGVKLLVRPLPRRPELQAGRRRHAARGDPATRPRCWCRRAGTAATPRCSASRSRRSAPRARPRSRPSCAAPACRWTSCPGPPIFSPGMEPLERAELGQRLVYGGDPGREDRARRRRDPETMAALFQMLLGGLDHARRPERARARSSGTSPTPTRGTWSSPTATRAWSRGASRRPRSRSSAATRTGPTCSAAASTRSSWPRCAACARRATCAGCGARGACSRR